jgi:hypothetical protein
MGEQSESRAQKGIVLNLSQINTFHSMLLVQFILADAAVSMYRPDNADFTRASKFQSPKRLA